MYSALATRQLVSRTMHRLTAPPRNASENDWTQISRRYLELRFRTRLGRSIRDELMRERIENVKSLLSTGNLTIGEIVQRTGFSSDSHLSQLFRKATGATMLTWRRENRETPDE